MKRIKVLIAAIAVMAFGALALVPVTSVSALDPADPLGEICTGTTDSQVCDNKTDNANDLIGMLVNTLLFVVGALATVMIIVGGIFYIMSNGDAGKVAKAKNTVLYSVIGLVVAFVAYAIINWVVKLFIKP